jgi:membrane-bound lytic murein transglycosylase F
MGGPRSPGLLLLLSLIPLLALASTATKSVRHEHWTKKYDQYFSKYAKHYFGPLVDWYWFKAQGIAESGLVPGLKSSAGAKGLMQILPATFREIQERNPHFTNIDDPRWNIAAGIYYDRMQFLKWKKGLPSQQRIAFALASYNAGYGNIKKAHKRAEDKHGEVREWRQVAPFAPRETRLYVKRIYRLMEIEE